MQASVRLAGEGAHIDLSAALNSFSVIRFVGANNRRRLQSLGRIHMKLKRATIENFKGVKSLALAPAQVDGILGPLTALLGDNGSGKTSVLQAIALTLSMATR